MDNITKLKFPYQVHLALGLIWVGVGLFLYTGVEMAIWTAGGFVMILVGLLNKK